MLWEEGAPAAVPQGHPLAICRGCFGLMPGSPFSPWASGSWASLVPISPCGAWPRPCCGCLQPFLHKGWWTFCCGVCGGVPAHSSPALGLGTPLHSRQRVQRAVLWASWLTHLLRLPPSETLEGTWEVGRDFVKATGLVRGRMGTQSWCRLQPPDSLTPSCKEQAGHSFWPAPPWGGEAERGCGVSVYSPPPFSTLTEVLSQCLAWAGGA